MLRFNSAIESYACFFVVVSFVLTSCGQVTPYGDIDLSQNWLWHQAITWTNVDILLAMFCSIDLRALGGYPGYYSLLWLGKLCFKDYCYISQQYLSVLIGFGWCICPIPIHPRVFAHYWRWISPWLKSIYHQSLSAQSFRSCDQWRMSPSNHIYGNCPGTLSCKGVSATHSNIEYP